jgi:uncharacterized protein (DUF58 family)
MKTSPEALLRRLEWTVLRRLDGVLQGDWRTLWRGGGMDLADLREYQPGDDARHIDWNVTARLNQPHVRQFTEERELSAWFLLDLSASVSFGSLETSPKADASRRPPPEGIEQSGKAPFAQETKLDVSTEFVAVLARLLTRQGNRVGAMFYRSAVDAILPPRSGRTQVLQLLKAMTAPAPLPRERRETALAELLRSAEAGIRRRSLVVVVSDFISTPGWQAAIGRLARRHEVIAVRLWDAAELALPGVGLLTVEDAETGEQLLIDTEDAGFRSRYEVLAAEQEASIRDGLNRAGVDTLELATGEDLFAAVMRFAAMRRLRLRGVPAAQRRGKDWSQPLLAARSQPHPAFLRGSA